MKKIRESDKCIVYVADEDTEKIQQLTAQREAEKQQLKDTLSIMTEKQLLAKIVKDIYGVEL